MRLSRARIEIADVVAVARGGERVSLASVTERDLADSRAVVEAVLAEGRPVYGLNTELGAGRNIVIDGERLEEFQRRAIRNSSGGIGDALVAEQARAVIFTRLAGFTRGGAGVTPGLAARYVDLLNHDIVPLVPRTGSVGAADLTQLAAVAAVVTGTGWAIRDGEVVPGADALAAAGIEPAVLQAHEAIAALSANSYSVGVSALLVQDARALVPAADTAVALSLAAIAAHGAGGSLSPFDPRIHAAHPVAAQAASAARIRGLLEGSSLAVTGSASTQDAISFRSAPQVHGAFAVAVARLAAAVELELNSRTENPLVEVESGELVSGGNFLALELALALENLRVALAHVAVASERRLAQLSALGADLRRSGRAEVPGLLWYAAAGQLAEVRLLANPVTLAGTSLSEGVEDISTHAPLALQLLERSVELVGSILAIEAASAVELIELSDAEPGPALAPLVSGIAAALGEGRPLDERVHEVTQLLLDQLWVGQ